MQPFTAARAVVLFSLTTSALLGCATITTDPGRAEVNSLLNERGLSVGGGSAALDSLLQQPLTEQRAVRIALLNNASLQASYASLGLAAADVYRAGRIANPTLAISVLDSDAAGELDQRTFGLSTSLADLITLPARRRLAKGAFAASQQKIANDVMTIAAQTRAAYYRYVSAKQIAALRAQIATSDSLAAALAQRFHQAGNLAAKELAMQRAAASAAKLDALAADADAFGTRVALASLLGISVGDKWDAPAQLPAPLATEDDLNALLASATTMRLDLIAAKTHADFLADRLGVVGWSRWLGDVHLGLERERETDGARLRGPTLALELPMFDQHGDKILRANADLSAAIANLRGLMNGITNDVRLAHALVANAKARVSEHQDVLIPQRIKAVARGQEELNFMLIGIFELIDLKQAEYNAYQGYLEALRDYWLARTKLSEASGSPLPSDARISSQRININDLIKPTGKAMDHSNHSMDHANHHEHGQTTEGTKP